MRYRFTLCSMLALALGLVPLGAAAQATDQTTTTAPMATATLNPGATENPMTSSNPMEEATATPGTTTVYQTTGENGNTGWWGLIGLIGLLGLLGGRRNRTNT
jgi:hypothetical protein